MDDRDALLASLNAAENEIDRLRQQIDELHQQLRDRDRTIQQAKDISPVVKPSLRRVSQLAAAALMDIVRVKPDSKRSFWLLSMGKLRRKFKSLREIWNILSQDNFYLSDIFEGFLSTGKPKPVTRAYRSVKQRKRFFYDPDEYYFYDQEQRMVLESCEQFYSQTYDSG